MPGYYLDMALNSLARNFPTAAAYFRETGNTQQTLAALPRDQRIDCQHR